MTVFSPSANCTKAIFLQAVRGLPIAIQGFFKAALQYKDRSDMNKVYVFKKDATILGWSAQSKLRIVLDPTCNDPVIQTSTSWISIPKFSSTTVQKSLHMFHTKYCGNRI